VRIGVAAGTTIGGTEPGARNVISGNDDTGVQFDGGATSGNLVQGNYIGTDATGSMEVCCQKYGVKIINGASFNTIGGTAPGARNVISGSHENGINITGSGTSGNLVQGNYIGTNSTGTSALGNWFTGVYIQYASGNMIGGVDPGAGNLISRNLDGVVISNTTGNLVQGNYIGTDATGVGNLGNTGHGVSMGGASATTVGGTTAGARNVISGNGTGIHIGGGSGNLVQGNYIGTDSTGSVSLGNGTAVVVDRSTGNTVGGTTAGARNVISGNGTGILVSGASTGGNLVKGNYIGTDVTGTVDLGNLLDGVFINNASDNSIGGTAAGAPNVISGNGNNGVQVLGNGVRNTIRGNNINSNDDAGIENISGGNTELAPPTVTASGFVSGTSTCLGCAVDIYSDEADEGRVYEGSTTTDGGTGSWSYFGGVEGPHLTTTVTDPAGNTSEFSSPFACGGDDDVDSACNLADNCPDDSNPGQENADADQWGDACDNCPSTSTLWYVPTGDEDCDGWESNDEGFYGTLTLDACPSTTGMDDEDPDAWPPDFDDSRTVDVLDLLGDPISFKNSYGAVGPNPPYYARFDLSMDGAIDVLDLLGVPNSFKSMYGMTCVP
jgi:titin